jgi:hypothetical protein
VRRREPGHRVGKRHDHRQVPQGASAAQRAALADRLDLGVDDKGAAGRDPSYGFGRVNLLKAAIG